MRRSRSWRPRRPGSPALLAAGRAFGIAPYGLDALNTLRIEKRHVTGAELNGNTSADDLGFGRMLKQDGDFVGRCLSRRPGLSSSSRLQLVGVRPVDVSQRLRNGAQLVVPRARRSSLGYVTSSTPSVEFSGWTGLALVAGGRERIGQTLLVVSAYPADVIEVSARRGRAPELETVARAAGLVLPAFGRVTVGAEQLVLCVRPGRWLWLTQTAAPGAVAAAWQARCAGLGFVVDLSSGLTALHLAGTATREMLTRRCRLDLDPNKFPAGYAAATLIAQVSVVLSTIPTGILLLTPSTTAQHFLEWIASAARPFGYRSELT